MRKRINLPVDKLIVKPNKLIKLAQEKCQTQKPLTFEELYRQARKQSHNSHPHPHMPYYSANTSQHCSQSLKSSINTPQNSNRNCAKKQHMKEKLNRSLESKSNSLEKLCRPTRSFSSEKKKLMEQWQAEKIIKQNPQKQFLREQLKDSPKKSEQQHFLSQFTKIINRLDHNNHSHLRETECFLTIQQIFQIMKQLHYLRKIEDQKHLVKIWQELQGQTYGGVPSFNLYEFLTYINQYNPKILLPKTQKSKSENAHKKIILNSNLKIVISEQSKLEIYEEYLALRVNRILYGSSEVKHEGLPQQIQRNSNIKIVDDDLEKSQKKEKSCEVKKMSFAKKNGTSSQELANPPVKRAVKLKSIANRAKKGEENLEKNKSEETICYSQISETKDSLSQKLTSNESENSIQNSQSNEQPIERKPILSIDVNLGEGLSQKLLVYEGQTAVEVSKRLVEKYNIDQTLRVKFQGMLNSHIRNLLWRIEEVSQQMFSDREQ